MKAADYRATAMTEAALLATVRAMAKRLGWLVYHTHNSKHSEAGFPDLVMVRRGVIIFAELKSQTGGVTSAQAEWLGRLEESCSGNLAVVWRPSDLPEIERILR